ncbi:hypothetical protein [Sphingomonas melonis]|uniref:Uncharacterized protein n=1 Tax=Sphingomonas melonis TaxID=152682 RepID=A0A7Y9FKJ7_9SPHN|nr:hypothetical protein [Sphingomonas melonis]NYD89004.1 hypothetical protein [Sphingomonas melonis]
MALDRVHLRKLLYLFLLSEKRRLSEIRSDALQTMERRDEGPSPGADFHAPFWRDAKIHAAGLDDLHTLTSQTMAKGKFRKRLYPLLRDGFLLWWNEKRRWINEPIESLPKSIKSTFGFAEIEGVVKVENLLSLKIGDDRFRYVYPYFCEKPPMDAETARLGLWLMSEALPDLPLAEMRILDVLRGEAYSPDIYPLIGNEEEVFALRYRRILREWRNQMT